VPRGNDEGPSDSHSVPRGEPAARPQGTWLSYTSGQATRSGSAVFAQSLVEYGALGSMLAGAQQAAYDAGARIHSLGALPWIALGVIVVVLLKVRRSRSRR
jgi:hypothetical protein